MYCPNHECLDYLESGRPGEYVAGVTVCPVCGAYLVEHLPPDFAAPADDSGQVTDQPQPIPDEDVEPVFETGDPSEVPIVKTLLESEGIPFMTRGEEHFNALRGSLSAFRYNPLGGTVLFLVPARFADSARELLVAIEGEIPEGLAHQRDRHTPDG